MPNHKPTVHIRSFRKGHRPVRPRPLCSSSGNRPNGRAIFSNSDSKLSIQNQVINDNLRHIAWKNVNSGSPAILRAQDLPELLGSSKLFARKFDIIVDASVLDMIDRAILNVSSSG